MPKIDLAKQFSRTPGPRYKRQGPFSGEEFREVLLEPAFARAVAAGEKLVVCLDGAAGYAASFLEEAFGGLAREHGIEKVLAVVEVTCADEPELVEEVRQDILRAITG